MGTLQEQLGDIIHEALPILQDGNYILADRRLLTKKGDHYTLIGHRDKRKYKELSRLDEQQLARMLAVRRGVSVEKLSGLPKHELINKLYPRPKRVFHEIWLQGHAPAATALRKLIKTAQKVGDRDYGRAAGTD